MAQKIRVGFIPEHFSTPIHYAQAKGYFAVEGLEVVLLEYPSGSGHLIQSLKSGEIDIAIGLTEAFVRGICDGDEDYKLVGTYVQSPLCWAISTGKDRPDVSLPEQLSGKRIGVSRIGSGSYVMSFVLAMELKFQQPFFSSFSVVQNFKNLRDSVNLVPGVEGSEAFMWEHFTSKRYYDSGEIRKIGQIYTPWPSWVVVSSASLDSTLVTKFTAALKRGIDYFNENPEESVKHIYTALDYSEEDAREWLKTVEFSKDPSTLDFTTTVAKTAEVLKAAGVIQQNGESDDTIQARIEAGIKR
ncbi:unnamed protein product [Kuraishia capsulata CBS 1993]|uniref:Ca3427-like PBP 2 domain-containing protein n=1 Tax=Kuraishia capsulata CBS 1993 TaxID=1382522 RepID=W6MNR2_9ASCO|nr:uncharacterized protein KUCA_T00004291001 [Kuraishia capsulata CBS 1993]CDK28309.1 unnamed protein product [Kuraishia capsulata CBS 1993]